MDFWPDVTIGSTRNTKSHAAVCNEAKKNLPKLNMATDLINEIKVLGKHRKCLEWNEETRCSMKTL